MGGVLNIVRKAPVSKQSVYARLAYGSYYNKQATMALGGKLIGPLNYRASVNWQDQEGWRSNATKRLSGYLALGGHLTENDELISVSELTAISIRQKSVYLPQCLMTSSQPQTAANI